MLLFIVPIFAKMFTDLGGKLPAPTQRAGRACPCNALKTCCPFLLVVVIVAVVVWKRVKHDERVRNVVDPLKLKMPVFGNLFQQDRVSAASPATSAP